MLGPEIKFVDRDYILFENKKLLYLAGIDYHRMSNNPIIIQAMSDAAHEFGLNPTGSRTTTGNHSLYIQLEKTVSNFFNSEAAAVFASGYISNMVLLQTIKDDFDIFFIDEVTHSSMMDATKLCDKKVISFKYLNPQHLKEQIDKNVSANSRLLVMTDGVFPSTGEIPPLKDYADVVKKYDGKILTDDAHAMAVIGKTGKGTWEEKELSRDLFFQTGTLSKGFGIHGGVIQGDSDLINNIQERSAAFAGSTGISLPLAAAAAKSISYLKSNPQIITELQKSALALKEKFRGIGFKMPSSPVPIFSITLEDRQKNQRLKQLLLNNGIYPPFINYPGSPPGGHFRFIITSITTREQIQLLFETIKSAL
ncbi:MAG: aminotransferase class I/II-fold pyridoxal phosphate-dependent enzyme [SAR324 cluster bacterium]|nr:aminotransferase class I/II-fold pyridoxal phosphate-dependent enzyme [SAR324 cluster bacterium]